MAKYILNYYCPIVAAHLAHSWEKRNTGASYVAILVDLEYLTIIPIHLKEIL